MRTGSPYERKDTGCFSHLFRVHTDEMKSATGKNAPGLVLGFRRGDHSARAATYGFRN